MTRLECYIEEYETDDGLAARLRDKITNKKISIQISSLEEKIHFLQFLSVAKTHRTIMPSVFNPRGVDVVAVYGTKQAEDEDTIFVDIQNGGGYLFE